MDDNQYQTQNQPPNQTQNIDPNDMEVSWNLNPDAVVGFNLQGIYATGTSILVKLGSAIPEAPNVWVGFRSAHKSVGSIGEVEPRILVHYFPTGVKEAHLKQTNRLVPGAQMPMEVNNLIGVRIDAIHNSDNPSLPIPCAPGGWLFQFGDLFMEIALSGLMFHKPNPTKTGKVQ